MIKKIIFLFIFLFSLLFITQSVFALTAESENYSISRFGSGLASYNLDSESLEGKGLLTTGASTRNAENEIYTANIGFFENTIYHIAVSITSYSISSRSAVIGSTMGLSISALNAENVWAKIIAPNGQEQILTLMNNQVVTYLPSPSVVGRYNVTFYANRSSGVLASAIDYFELTEPVAVPPSGGGGGTTTIIEKCAYIWDCTPWSICSAGNQTRACTNIGTCKGIEGKPREEMLCSEALFDILLKFKEVQLTANETLKFNVDLTETKGIEKIDVYLKYSIIDSKNNEIFSQTETRAIMENLSYEKELSEIKLKNGEYTLRIDLIYGNLQKAFAEQRFEVLNSEITIKEGSTNSGKMIGFLKSIGYTNLLILIICILAVLIIILLRRKISAIWYGLKERFSKYPEDSINGLIGKKVYSEDGNYIGKIVDLMIWKGRIFSLKIKLDNHDKLNAAGIVINYERVKNVGEIVILDEKIMHEVDGREDSVEDILKGL